MMTREISPQHWKAFCEKVTETCRGVSVSLESTHGDGSAPTRINAAPLVTLALDTQSNACNNVLVLELEAAPGRRPTRHVVTEPIHIRLKNGENDRYNSVHILAESGATTVKLSPGLSPAQLENWGVV